MRTIFMLTTPLSKPPAGSVKTALLRVIKAIVAPVLPFNRAKVQVHGTDA